MKNSLKRRTYRPRRNNLRRRNVSIPLVIILTAVLVLGLCAGFYFFLLPVLQGKGAQTVTPTPPSVSATPDPVDELDFSEIQETVAVNALQYKWFASPTIVDGSMLFAAGQAIGNDVCMDTLFTYDLAEKKLLRLTVSPVNTHFISPVMNSDWLVYVDAKADGGGQIIAHARRGGYDAPMLVKEVYTGLPTLQLYGNYLAWIERTGSYMDKLFVCDLTTNESVTLQMFDKSYYGVSKPNICGSKLLWADVESEVSSGSIFSRITCVDFEDETDSFINYDPKTYVHDPKSDGGDCIAWLDGNHGPQTKLYVRRGDGEKEVIAEGVVDFFMDEGFIAYQKDQIIYVYMTDSGKTYDLTSNAEQSQLLSASGGYVMWLDVSSRERDVIKYALIP